MAGGVALNCVANGRILREGPFSELFVQPAAGDAGGALGAAALCHLKLTGHPIAAERLRNVCLGPKYSTNEIDRLIGVSGIQADDYRDRESELMSAIVDRLIDRRVIGWFHGPLEFGPRALGERSILADPRDPQMRDRLNRMVKKREAFRPFAPSVLAEYTSHHFHLDHASPFMLETCLVDSPLDLPAVTHVDGSARPQTVDRSQSPRFAALLDEFYRRTGCPMLVNTSFNVRGEPIVCSPGDALATAINSGIDTLVLEDFLIDRESIPDGLFQLVRQSSPVQDREAISPVVYTFI
jgi:carbamoyltransferase